MKKTLILVMVSTFYGISFSQKSGIISYSEVTTSQLVPYEENTDKNSPIKIKPNFKGKELMEDNSPATHNPDWVWQQHENLEKASTATTLWQAGGLTAGVSPYDPTCDADSLVFMQAINGNIGAIYRTYNKNTGTGISGTLTMQTLGGPAGLGDPIILYHKSARRWILTEFSNSGNKLLVHVSQTSSPTGAYFTHQFTCTQFPDYPKYAISETSDALIVSTNEGGPPSVYAMRLSTLLAGTATAFINATPDVSYSLNGFGFQSITPVDLEGDMAAPAGMKPLFMRHRDDESHTAGSPDSGTNDWIELWEMTINWGTNAVSIAKIQDIAVTEFDSKLCGLTSFTCIPQPGTTNKLDPLREPLMYKVPMRVFNDHQAIVMAFATDVTGTDRSGVRWVEIRRATGSLGAWSLYQEGTYSPGTTNRWMPAINIDKEGNILMAYSTSSATAGDFPSLKYTGRKPCDPLGQMTITETTIIAGTSSKGGGDTRWGDYHHMSVDPFKDDVFYFTGLYESSGDKTRNCAVKINPYVTDATILSVFQVTPGDVCGSSTQIGVVVQNKGTAAISNGTIQWQVGTGSITNYNYSTSDLPAVGSIDTIYISISGLALGPNTVNLSNYTVNVSTPDENICNDLNSISINSIPGSGFTATSNVDIAPSCNPGGDGQISLTPTGGTGPFAYSVNGGLPQASNIFTGISQGNLNYIITDATGCSASGTMNVAPNVIITTTPSVSSAILCFGGTGEVSVSASGGTASYTYSNDGASYQASNIYSGVTAGTYTYYAKDGNGCIGSNSLVVSQPTSITLNAVPTAISCFGANDGAITANASNGTPGYTYSLDGVTYQASNSFTGLNPGSYTVYVKDNNGCTKTYNTSVIQPSQVTVSGVATISNGSNGTITLTGNGGNMPYTYSLDGITYQSGSLFNGLAGGDYTCYVQDNNGCINTVVVHVNQVGIEELEVSTLQVVTLYPNPTSGLINLEVKGITGKDIKVKIFNMSGQLISELVLNAIEGEVNQTVELSKKIANGQYYFGIYDGDISPIITKIVKQ